VTDNSAVEALRWATERTSFPTPEAFEASREEPWIRPGTRNHGTFICDWHPHIGETGLTREVRRNDDELLIEREHAGLLPSLVVGRTIVAIERDTRDLGMGADSVTITLDDGSTLDFEGWGHDEWGLNLTYGTQGRG